MSDIHAKPRPVPHAPIPHGSVRSSLVEHTVEKQHRRCTLTFDLGLRGSSGLPLDFKGTEFMADVIEVLRGQCPGAADAEAQIVFNGEFVVSDEAQYREVQSRGDSALWAVDVFDLIGFANNTEVTDKRFYVTWIQRTDVGTSPSPSAYLDPAGNTVCPQPQSQVSNMTNSSAAIDHTQRSGERNVAVRFEVVMPDIGAPLTLYFEGDDWISDVIDVIRSQLGLAPEDEVWLAFNGQRISDNPEVRDRANREYLELMQARAKKTTLPTSDCPRYARDVNALERLQRDLGRISVRVVPFRADVQGPSRAALADTLPSANPGPRKLKFIDGFDQKLALPFSGDWSIDRVIEAVRSEWNLPRRDEIKVSVDGRRIVSDEEQFRKLVGKEPVILARTMSALMEVEGGRFHGMRLQVSYPRHLEVLLPNGLASRIPYFGKEKLRTVYDEIREKHNVPWQQTIHLLLEGSAVYWHRGAYEHALKDPTRTSSSFPLYYADTIAELHSLSGQLQVQGIRVRFFDGAMRETGLSATGAEASAARGPERQLLHPANDASV